ncbi:MAG: lipopolysaccharide kinase InaA family protein [Planctomycetes bacterium]|nr:lipopolysaccharide kinase InaA family protein [Planctomycetota bacterium]
MTQRFVRASTGGAETFLRADVAPCLLAAGIADPESLRGRSTATYEGRGRPFGFDARGVGRVFVRPYLHGGVFGAITRDRHAGDGRFESEVEAHVAAAAAGVPVCEALGFVSRSAGGIFRRGWLVLRELPGARDLLAVLSAPLAAARRRAILAAAGRAVRALHDAGFDHPDLHLKNLLLDDAQSGEVTVRVLDLDRTVRVDRLPRERRLAGLFRFDRYAAKQAAAGAPITRADRLRVFVAYAGPDWPAREERRAIARRLRRHIGRHARLTKAAS